MSAKPKLKLAVLKDFSFVHGVGSYPKKQACTMSGAVAVWRASRGEDLNGATDSLECVDPVVRALVIRRNDLTPLAQLKPWAVKMIPKIIGTFVDDATSLARAAVVARFAVRVIAADALDFAKLHGEAAKLRALRDEQPLAEFRAAALDAKKAADAAYAADAADADAADAAADAAYAAYAAAAYAAHAADAAADAAYAAAAAAAYAADAADAAAAAYVRARRRLSASERIAMRLEYLDAMLKAVLQPAADSRERRRRSA